MSLPRHYRRYGMPHEEIDGVPIWYEELGDPVDQLGDVVGEPLDRDGAAGVGRVAVALELDADHAPALGEPRQDVVEAAVEGHDATVQGDERGSRRVTELLVPDGDAVDLVVGHALVTLEASQVQRPTQGSRCERDVENRVSAPSQG